jgi:hypothetical protein
VKEFGAMPRERITPYRRPGVYLGGANDGKPVTDPPFIVDVGWDRDGGSINIHTGPDAGAGRIVLDMVNDWLSRAGEPTIDIDRLFAADPGFGWSDAGGFYTHLDARADVNRLITVLRRARDQAYGKDA